MLNYSSRSLSMLLNLLRLALFFLFFLDDFARFLSVFLDWTCFLSAKPFFLSEPPEGYSGVARGSGSANSYDRVWDSWKLSDLLDAGGWCSGASLGSRSLRSILRRSRGAKKSLDCIFEVSFIRSSCCFYLRSKLSLKSLSSAASSSEFLCLILNLTRLL